MASLIQPLSSQVPIVDDEGKPLPSFITMLQKLGVGTGLDGSSGSIALAAMAAKTILANKTVGSAAPTACTLSDILDFASSTRGSILYRGNTGWAALAPGSSGQFLKTNGAGADPAWATGGGSGGVSPDYATLTAPSTSNFTLVSGAGSPSVANVTRGVALSVPGAGAVDRNALLEVTPGGSTWTMTSFLVPSVWWRNFVTFGLYAKESGTGKIHAFCQAYNSALVFRQLRWTNITTFSASTDIPTIQIQGPMWFKLQLDATNLTASISPDGENFLQIYQVAKGSFLSGTIDRAGIFFGVNQQATGGYPQNITEYLTVMSYTLV
jgi:hypothetical protein